MEEKNDFTDFVLLIFVAIVIIFYLLSTVWFHHLAGTWYFLKIPVMNIINYIPKSFFDYLYFWTFWDHNYSNNIKGATDFLLNQGYSNFKDQDHINEQLQAFNFNQKEFVTFYDRLVITFYSPFIALILIRFYKKISGKERFQKIYSNKTLSEQESNIWTPIKPIVYEFEKMTNGSPYDQKNWWAGAETPLDYLEKREVLIKYKKEEDDDFEKKEYFIKLDVKKLHKIYVEELGDPWKGFEHLSFEEKCVFAIIIPKLYRDNTNSKKLRDIMARYYASKPYKKDLNLFFTKKQLKNIFLLQWGKLKIKEKLKYKKIRKDIIKDKAKAKKEIEKNISFILNKYYWKKTNNKMFKKKEKKEIRDEIKNITKKHYYKNAVFVKLLLEARSSAGVLAACEMIWAKIENRPFWYVLSQTGRAAAFPEVSGLWSHYLAEEKVKRRMAAPRVENAILAADKYMFNTHDNYEPFNEMQEE